jgi:cytochrome c553
MRDDAKSPRTTGVSMRRGYLILAAAACGLCLFTLITLAQPQSQERRPDLQHGALIAAQGTASGTFTLREWQRGYRKNSPDEMAVVAQKLNDYDIGAVAAYYQQSGSPLKLAEAQLNAQTKE